MEKAKNEMGQELNYLGFVEKGKNKDGMFVWSKNIGRIGRIDVCRYGKIGTKTVGYDVFLYVIGNRTPITLCLSATIDDLKSRCIQFLVKSND